MSLETSGWMSPSRPRKYSLTTRGCQAMWSLAAFFCVCLVEAGRDEVRGLRGRGRAVGRGWRKVCRPRMTSRHGFRKRGKTQRLRFSLFCAPLSSRIGLPSPLWQRRYLERRRSSWKKPPALSREREKNEKEKEERKCRPASRKVHRRPKRPPLSSLKTIRSLTMPAPS